jgi:hypothetical protein
MANNCKALENDVLIKVHPLYGNYKVAAKLTYNEGASKGV